MARPIAISCGEPAGIGPEIAVKAWEAVRADFPVVWIGDPTHLPEGTPWGAFEEADATQVLPVIARDFGAPRVPGVPDPAHAHGVIDAIATGVRLTQDGTCAGLCTAPIHKAALIDGANFAYPGHTEYLASLAGDVPVVMMLACDALRVVPATIHIALADVAEHLTASLLTDTLLITHA